jgi:hypothetical protein
MADPRRVPAWLKALTGVRWGETPPPNGFEIAAAICSTVWLLVFGSVLVLQWMGQPIKNLGPLGVLVSFAFLPVLLVVIALSVAGMAVRHRQNKWPAQGRCARCGYDLKALPEAEACPECGHGRWSEAHD